MHFSMALAVADGKHQVPPWQGNGQPCKEAPGCSAACTVASPSVYQNHMVVIKIFLPFLDPHSMVDLRFTAWLMCSPFSFQHQRLLETFTKQYHFNYFLLEFVVCFTSLALGLS